MSARLHRWRPGLLAALFALLVQLVLGISMPEGGIRPTPDQQLAALLADPGAICHRSADSDKQAPHHHGFDCLLCPYCAAIGAAAVLRTDDPTLPIPRAGQIALAVAAPPPVTLPPPSKLTAQPRGPPILA